MTINRLLKFFAPIQIDTLYYEIKVECYTPRKITALDLEIRTQNFRDKTIYSGWVDGKVIHKSILYNHNLLLIQSGLGNIPVIGNCMTIPEYRGFKVYPHVLSFIIGDLQKHASVKKVGIFVNPDNQASIRGIEQAGFNYISRVRGLRVGLLFISHKES